MARVGQLEDQTRIMSRTVQGYGELIQKYESKIEELLKIGLANTDQIRALETQNQSLMKLIKDSANEQVTVTQSWAQVVAGAPAANSSSATTPASRPSLPRSSVNPGSSASQTSNLSQSAIVVDLSRTTGRARDFLQLKDKVNEALKRHQSTREVICTGVQRRAGGGSGQALFRIRGDGQDSATTWWPVAPRESVRPGPHARGKMVPGQG